MNRTTEAALELLERGGNAVIACLSIKVQVRPSDVLKALRTYKGYSLTTIDDEEQPDDYAEVTFLQSTPSAEDMYLRRILSERLDRALGSLTARQRQVVGLLYALDYESPYSYAESADALGITRQAIQQHHNKAINILREELS